MKNAAFRRTLDALAHPVSIGAILLLLINDHILRRFWPSWWTGKIGDFAWLVFAPFALAAVLAWLIPSRWKRQEKIVGSLAFVLIGLVFALAKTTPAFLAVVVRLLEITSGGPVGLRSDPTDLLAIPALLVGWHVWTRDAKPPVPRTRGWSVLVLAVMATIASDSSPTFDYGITCLIEQDSALYAIGPVSSGYGTRAIAFRSRDGGLNWREERFFSLEEAECVKHTSSWQLTDPSHQQVVYRFVPGEAVERSEDSGQTWRREVTLSWKQAHIVNYERSKSAFWVASQVLPTPLDAWIDPTAGQLVVAMGHEGVLVRMPDTQWRWVSVGPYARGNLAETGSVQSLLSGELGLGAILVFLIAGTLARRVRHFRLSYLWMAVAWVFWGIALMASPAISYDPVGIAWGIPSPGQWLVILPALVAVPWGLYEIIKTFKLSPSALLWMGLSAASGVLLFVLPYILWSQGAIPHYGMAKLFAILLSVTSLFAGDRCFAVEPSWLSAVISFRRAKNFVFWLLAGVALTALLLIAVIPWDAGQENAGQAPTLISVTPTPVPLSLTEVSFYPTPNKAEAIAAAGNYAYIVDGNKILRILFVADATHPTEVGSYQVPGYSLVGACGQSPGWLACTNPYQESSSPLVVAAGGHVYIRNCNGVQIVNVFDPTHPVEAGHYGIQGSISDLIVVGSYAYIAQDRKIDGTQLVEGGGLHIVNISDPIHPLQTGFYNLSRGAEGIAVSGNYAYVTDKISGTHVVDISNPAIPTEISSLAEWKGGSSDRLVAARSYAYYVADYYEGMYIINISDPTRLKVAGFYDVPQGANRVTVTGNYAQVVSQDNSLYVIDVSDPMYPVHVGLYKTPDQIHDIVTLGRYTYLATQWGLRIIQLTP